MSDEMNVKISEIKAKFIKNEAKMVDRYFGNGDGYISKEEGAKLAQVLSGDLEKKKNQKKLAKESDEVKAMFGLTVSTPVERTQAPAVISAAAPSQVVDDANKAIGEAAKKTFKTPYEEVKARFLEVMEYNEETNTSNGTTTKQAYKAVEKEFKGKEYKEALKELKDYAKHAFVNMRAQKTRAAVQAYDEQGRLVNPENLQYDTSKKVYAREKELVKQNNNGVDDKWARKALRNKNTSALKIVGRYLSGNPSAGKTDDKAVAAGNRAVDIRENKVFTKDEIIKALGEDNPLLQPYTDTKGRQYENVLVATGLITVNDKGEYRVKELSKVVGGSVGADNTLNDHNNHNESEIQAVLTNLYLSMKANGSGEFKTKELTDRQVRDLVKFLGYGDDRTQLKLVRMWQHIWKGVGTGAAAGAAAGAANGRVNIDIKQHQEVNLNLDGFTAEQRSEFINALKTENELSGIEVTANTGNGMVGTTIGNLAETALGIYISQDQMVNGTVVSLLKSIAVGAMAGAGVGAAIGVIEGLLSSATEKEVFGMLFDCDTTYDDIIDTIDNAYSDKHLSPEMKAALKEVAKLGIVTQIDPKTGVRKAVLDKDCKVQWDYCQFIEEYNKARGNQVLNAAEVRAAQRTAEKHEFVVPDCDPKKEQVQKPEQKCEDCGLTKNEKPVETEAFKYNITYGYGYWPNIIDAFYDLDCMKEEAKKAGYKNVTVYFKHEICRRPDGTYDEAMFQKLKAGYIPKFISLPEQIGDCKLDRNGKVQFHQPQGAPKGYVNGVTVKQTGNEVTLTDCKGRTGKGNSVDSALSNLNGKLASGEDPYTKSDIKK